MQIKNARPSMVRRVIGATQRIILTGGPGAGKTSVLDILRARGFETGADTARGIIQRRKAAGLSPRPAARSFAEQLLEQEIGLYDSMSTSPAFFERGVPDAAAFLFGEGGLDDAAAQALMDRYRYDRVLVFPPWAEIYVTDAERDHSFEHAVRVCDATRRWYRGFGYTPIEVPLASPAARAEFVLAHLPGDDSG